MKYTYTEGYLKGKLEVLNEMKDDSALRHKFLEDRIEFLEALLCLERERQRKEEADAKPSN